MNLDDEIRLPMPPDAHTTPPMEGIQATSDLRRQMAMKLDTTTTTAVTLLPMVSSTGEYALAVFIILKDARAVDDMPVSVSLVLDAPPVRRSSRNRLPWAYYYVVTKSG